MTKPEENTHPFHIRLATTADSQLLSEIGSETFSDSFAADNTPENMAAYLADSFYPEKQAQELADPDSLFLIVELDHQTVGYARLIFGQAPTVVVGEKPMEIVRFYARKPWIGKGVPASLMQACLQEAKRRSCDVVWLGVWENNPRAIRFYRKKGLSRGRFPYISPWD
jgi:diamine N-acetyltransferase